MTWLRNITRLFHRATPPALPDRVDPLPLDDVRTLHGMFRATDAPPVPVLLALQLAETVLDTDRRLRDAERDRDHMRRKYALALERATRVSLYAARLQDLRAGRTPDDARCLHCGDLYDGNDLDDDGYCSATCREQGRVG